MNLNTYRCGCGRIETLPHAKARPGPCTHKVLPDVELTPWRPVDVRMPPGWAVTEALVRQRGDEVFLLLARKRGRKDVGLAYAREKPHMRRPALDVLRRTCAAQQQRAEGFFTALRGLVKQLNFARAGGMRPRTAESGMPPWAGYLPDAVNKLCCRCRGHRADRCITTPAGPAYYCPGCDPTAATSVALGSVPVSINRRCRTTVKTSAVPYPTGTAHRAFDFPYFVVSLPHGDGAPRVRFPLLRGLADLAASNCR